MQFKRLLSKKRMGISLGSLVVASLILGVILVNFVQLPETENAPPIINEVLTTHVMPEVEASCTVVLNGRPYFPQEEDETTEELTLIITLPDGTPLEGVCLTFTRDRGVGEEPEVIGSCTTDADGRCTILSPGGVINVLFGNTKIGGIPVNNSTDTLVATGDATTGGVSYYFPGDDPAEENIVANPAEDGSGISMEHAEENEDGELEPLPPGPGLPPGIDWGDWDLTGGGIDGSLPPWIIIDGVPYNTELPTGIVAVNFVPFILHTTQAYSKVYCYYNTGESGYVRVPSQVGSFLPGGGTYFDLGAVLNGNARPKLVLEAEKDEFEIDMECWGWQGNELAQIGADTTAQESTLWIGQPLLMESGGFALEYALVWDGPEVEPENPRLIGYGGPIGSTGVDSELAVAANQTRFSSSLIAPSEVVGEDDTIKWEYAGSDEIGGFRIYRNGYLIGSAPPNARAWQGDGLALLECGQPAEIVMTTYLAGQESVPSTPTRIASSNCVAQVSVNIESIEIRNLQDCDGDACATAAEAYGYLAVNDVIIYFGGTGSEPYSVGIQNDTTYPFTSLLAPFGKSNIINVGLGDTDALNIEVVLFDRDFNTTDDLVCTLQEIFPARDADGWASQDGRRVTRSGIYGEADCDITIELTIQE